MDLFSLFKKKQSVPYILSLNQPRDIPLMLLLKKIAPRPFKIVVTHFKAKDEYEWPGKRKYLERCLRKRDIAFLRQYAGQDVIVCTSLCQYKSLLTQCAVHVSRGREFSVLKPIARRNIALSLNRCYFNRLLDVLPYYTAPGFVYKIIMQSNTWLDERVMGSFMMSSSQGYDLIHNQRDVFVSADILGAYYGILKREPKANVRERLGIAPDKKVAFLSFRKAEEAFSFHRDNDAFMRSTIGLVKQLYDAGYYIISRRRLGQHDVKTYKRLQHPDVERFSEIKQYVHREMNGSEGFPSEIWNAMYAADVHVLADVSGICYVEAALCRCPVVIQYEDEARVKEKLQAINPAIKDMFDRGLFFRTVEEATASDVPERIESFVKRWYATNDSLFWSAVLGTDEDNETRKIDS